MRYPICNYLNHQPSHYSGFSRGYRPRMESIEKVEGGANHIAIPEDGMSIVLPSQKDAIEILYKTAREAYFASNAADNKASPWFPLVYIGCMVKLKLNQELFYLGHQLVNSCPNDAVSWYCVGCYYFSCGKLDFAHRYIKRCLKKDPEFFLGWLMLGHILSLQEESEQAVAAYRSAVRLQPNNFFPLLCLGKEFIRTNNLSLAAHTLSGARNLCSVDAHVLNELGVVFVRLERFTEALQFFNWSLSVIQMEQTENQNAIAAASTDSQSMKEKMVILKSNYSRSLMGDDQVCEVMYNFATTLRKMKEYDEARSWYERCLSLSPQRATTLAALGFTLHLSRKFDEAISYYHRALGVNPNLSFCTEMLTLALEDHLLFEKC